MYETKLQPDCLRCTFLGPQETVCPQVAVTLLAQNKPLSIWQHSISCCHLLHLPLVVNAEARVGGSLPLQFMSWLPLEFGTGEVGWDVQNKQDFLLEQVWTSELEMGTETTISCAPCGQGEPALYPPWDWGFLPPETSLDVGGSQEFQCQAGWRGGPIGRAAGPGVPRTGGKVRVHSSYACPASQIKSPSKRKLLLSYRAGAI